MLCRYNHEMTISIAILAAGKGTRMGSELPKVLHPLHQRPMIHYVLDTAQHLHPREIYMIVGHESNAVLEAISNYHVTPVMQHKQLGTGHAVCQVSPHFNIEQEEDIIILSGDCPLISIETLSALKQHHQDNQLLGTVLSTKLDAPAQYGRILRNKDNTFYAIREAKDCDEDQLKISEINAGIYCFNSNALFHYLKQLNTNNAQGEYYLTDVLEAIGQKSGKIDAFTTDNSNEILGVNTPTELAHLESLLSKTS